MNYRYIDNGNLPPGADIEPQRVEASIHYIERTNSSTLDKVERKCKNLEQSIKRTNGINPRN